MGTADPPSQELELSVAIEALLVARNPRGMQAARDALRPGYMLRAAGALQDAYTRGSGTVLIGTGFPVTGTFETDGPAGSIALYRALETLGARPLIACGPPLCQSLSADFRVLSLAARDLPGAEAEAKRHLARLRPDAVIAIERPGLAADGHYYNMRRKDISERCYFFDPYVTLADCPTIGVGDGGNEIGMGNIVATLSHFDITPSVTCCDELVVADVSNWGAYALVALLGRWAGQDLLGELAPLEILNYLSRLGSVDGVTGANTLTEDGMPVAEGLQVIAELRALIRRYSD